MNEVVILDFQIYSSFGFFYLKTFIECINGYGHWYVL